jgi:Uma2 family endonuclease
MATHTLITAEQFDQLPPEEGRRYELLDGELIEMPSANPKHNWTLLKLGSDLMQFLEQTGWGVVLPDTEFAFGAQRRLRPDLAVVRAEKWAQMDLNKVPIAAVPDIVVEIVSPSESAYDLNRKVVIYLEAGVSEVMIIYPDGQHVYVHSGTGVRWLRGTDTLTSDLLPGWSLAVSRLFPVQ